MSSLARDWVIEYAPFLLIGSSIIIAYLLLRLFTRARKKGESNKATYQEYTNEQLTSEDKYRPESSKEKEVFIIQIEQETKPKEQPHIIKAIIEQETKPKEKIIRKRIKYVESHKILNKLEYLFSVQNNIVKSNWNWGYDYGRKSEKHRWDKGSLYGYWLIKSDKYDDLKKEYDEIRLKIEKFEEVRKVYNLKYEENEHNLKGEKWIIKFIARLDYTHRKTPIEIFD